MVDRYLIMVVKPVHNAVKSEKIEEVDERESCSISRSK